MCFNKYYYLLFLKKDRDIKFIQKKKKEKRKRDRDIRALASALLGQMLI